MKRLIQIICTTVLCGMIFVACGSVDEMNGASQTTEWRYQDVQKGVNMDAYCKRKFGQQFAARLVGSTTGDWVCEANAHERRGISVVEACEWQQNTRRVGYGNVNDPLSWYCLVSERVWVPVRVGVNMDAYCKRQYGQQFASKVIGTTVGDWVCEANAHERRGISVRQACLWQHNTDRHGYYNFNDPLSWYCEK